MKLLIFISLVFLFSFTGCKDTANRTIVVSNLTCEYLSNPIGIDSKNPRFGWQIDSKQKNKSQTAFQLLISSDMNLLKVNKGDVLNTDKVFSSKQTSQTFKEIQLKRDTKYYWKVRVWDESGQMSNFSNPAYFETGLLESDDWRAKWITSSTVYDWNRYYSQLANQIKNRQRISYTPEILLSKLFRINKKIKSARLYISGLGFYNVMINDHKVSDSGLNPAFTDYNKRILYNTYDVTSSLTTGKNNISVGLGNGFYNEETIVDWGYGKASWRGRPKLKCQLNIQFEDGGDTIVASDTSWHVAPSHLLRNSFYAGELLDNSIDYSKYPQSNIRDKAILAPEPVGKMVSQAMPLETINRTFHPASIKKLRNHSLLIDGGINLSGRLEIRFDQSKGDTIELKYGELLNHDGTVDQSNINRNTLDMIQTDVVILSGKGQLDWAPKYEYHGFRYVEVKGYHGVLTPDDVTVQFVHTNLEKTGSFACSSPLINKLQKATIQSYLSNYHGYPTDCPQREKNGWTADAHLAARTGLYNFNMINSYEKWMNDFDDALLDDGRLPGIVPTSGWGYQIYHNIMDPMGPAWDAAYILIPWYVYVYTGDTKILSDHYKGMKKLVEYIESRSPDHIVNYGLADWAYYKTATNWEVTSTCYYAVMARTLSDIANTLGFSDDKKKYHQLYGEIKEAFNKKFYDPRNMSYAAGSQTARAGAVYCGFTDSLKSRIIVDNLEKEIKNNGYHLDCGILGAEFILKTLAEHNRGETAYRVISNKRFPGWGYWIAQGSTTLWESWNKNNSKNHIMYGHISEWFYKYIAGIQPDKNSPGFKHFRIAPIFPKELGWASANTETPYGEIKSEWKRMGRKVQLSVTIPFNTTGSIVLPRNIKILSYKNEIPSSRVSFVRNTFVIGLGSGKYDVLFEVSDE
jgi:alpha-L-rhamnosidase